MSLFDSLVFVPESLKRAVADAGVDDLPALLDLPLDSALRSMEEFSRLFVYAFLIIRLGVREEQAAIVVVDYVESDSPKEAAAIRLVYGDALTTELIALADPVLVDLIERRDDRTIYDLVYLPITELEDDVGEVLHEFQVLARLVVEAGIAPDMARAISRGAPGLDGPQLRNLESDRYVSLVMKLRRDGLLPSNTIVSHPGRLLVPPLELPEPVEEAVIEVDERGRAFSVRGKTRPGALVRLEDRLGGLVREASVEEQGLFRFEIGDLGMGDRTVLIRQKPARAVAFSEPVELRLTMEPPPAIAVTWEPSDSASEVAADTKITINLGDVLLPENSEDIIVYLAGERTGRVPTTLDAGEDGSLILSPHTMLHGRERYTLYWGGFKEPLQPSPIVSLGTFTTGEALVPEIVAIEPAALSVAPGLLGRPMRLELLGTNLPHGLDLSLGPFDTWRMSWLTPDRLEVWAVMDRVGEFPVILSLPDGPVRSEVTFTVNAPLVPEMLLGSDEQPGPPRGTFEVVLPTEMVPPFPMIAPNRGGRVAPIRRRFFGGTGTGLRFEMGQWRPGEPIRLSPGSIPPEQEPEEDTFVPLELDSPLQLTPLDPLIREREPNLGLFGEEIAEREPMGEPVPEPDQEPDVDPEEILPPQRCAIVVPAARRSRVEGLVGETITLTFTVDVTEETLFTLEHRTGGRGTVNGGWSRRFTEPATVRISLRAMQAGTVDLQAQLWCPGRSHFRFITVVVNLKRPVGLPGGGGGPLPPPTSGGPGGAYAPG